MKSTNGLTTWVQQCRRALLLGGALLIASGAQAGVLNGNFETGDFTGWSVEYLTNPPTGIATFPPTQKSDLGLTASTAVANGSNTSVVGAAAFPDGPLTAPLQGRYSANVNHRGSGNKAGGISQTATMTLADVDPTDNKLHIRMAVAPVIQDGGHAPSAQAYFFVEVTNITKGKQLFQTFNFANQPGVPWQTIGSYQYTGWQAIDVAPGNGFLDVGDQVKVEVLASGCNAGGHSGEVYVDSIGPFFPGLLVSAVGPTTALAGSDVTYTYTYSNTSGVTVTDAVVDAVTPQTKSSSTTVVDTTFKSLNAPGAVCTTPAVGATGTVSCNFGMLNDHSSGTFDVTYTVPGNATGTEPDNRLNHGNYRIKATGASTILGPLVQSKVLTSGILTDLAVTLSDGVSAVQPNGALVYTVVVSNNSANGVTGATLSQTASSLTVGAWTCVASGGAACGHASGTGVLTGETLDVPAGGTVTYTINATAAAAGSTSTVFTVAPPAGTTDSNTANNSAGDTNAIGALHTLNVSINGSGSVASVPAGISCGNACTMAVVDGGQVLLTASAPAGSIFKGWGGACTGTTNPCDITGIAADVNVVANFAPVVTVTAVVGANGSASPTVPQVVDLGGTVAYTLTPANGYYPAVSGSCPGTLVGNTYTVGPTVANCTVNFGFSNIAVTSTAGPNGTVSTTGPQGVPAGGQVSYTLTPDPGYVARVVTGGNACTGTLVNNVFTTDPVNSSCTVQFIFVRSDAALGIPTLSQWGLILLSALMAMAAYGTSRRRMH